MLAHLLSKKRYDVVSWGAMQFLELGRNARRKLRLEQILLMLVRMGLIALIALGLARPWVKGGFLTNLVSHQPRDVVLVIDGSYSMGWEGRAATPHHDAVAWANRFLEELGPGDTVAVIDAREQPRFVIESPTRDFRRVRKELSELPPPAGSSDLADATARAVQILSRTTNPARDVIVLTDGQAYPWHASDENLWLRLDDLRKQPAVKPRVWVVNVGEEYSTKQTNFAVERLELSRELTVADFPIRIQTKIRSSGEEAATRRVYLEVDGQRLKETTLTVQIPPAGEATVEFEYRPPSIGSHVVSVVLDDDPLPGDNRADAALAVTEALPVLLIDGDPQPDPARSETFFAQAALSATGNDTPWVAARVVRWDAFQSADLDGVEAVLLANVPALTETQAAALTEFVGRGGGLFVALGDRVDAAEYNRRLYQ
ncbi:MAG: vWA domain-containing protein, partial [Planctomycetaceae bacterium]